MSSEVLGIIEQLCREKGIDKEILIEALKSAMEAAARKRSQTDRPLQTEFNSETGEVEIFSEKTIVDEVTSSDEEISLEEAQSIHSDVKAGESLLVQLPLKNFGRIAAQTFKQVMIQRFRDDERQSTLDEFSKLVGTIVTGTAQRYDHGAMIVQLDRTEAVMLRSEQIPGEQFAAGDRVRALRLECTGHAADDRYVGDLSADIGGRPRPAPHRHRRKKRRHRPDRSGSSPAPAAPPPDRAPVASGIPGSPTVIRCLSSSE